MATYKVIQDIEAEDKFLGPLTLKQFVFGSIGVLFLWLSFFSYTKGLVWLIFIFIFPMALGFFLAFPWSKDQPTEVWVLARLRFHFKPRKRIWDQAGMEELVTITVPPKDERPLIDNLSKTEVRSRLQVLAETIDSRGWAIKNAQMQKIISPDNADRLISTSSLPQEIPLIDTASIPDVYDSPEISDDFDRKIKHSTELHKQQTMKNIDNARYGGTNDSIHITSYRPRSLVDEFIPKPENQTDTKEEKALSNELKNRKTPDLATSRMHRLDPEQGKHKTTTINTPVSPVEHYQASKPPTNPVILELANNNDLNISTIARQAKKETSDGDEVEILLR